MKNLIYRIKYILNIQPYYGIKKSLRMDDLLERIKRADNPEKSLLLEERHKIVLDYIDKKMSQFRGREMFTNCTPAKSDLDDKNIWIFWAQGKNNMPPIINACYNSLLENSNGHRVILIDMNNLREYLDINPTILNKIGKEISYTFFSDYLRLNLLVYYGGLWIDSSYLVTKPITDNVFNGTFFSLHKDIKSDNVSKGRWSGNLIYTTPHKDYIENIRNMYCRFREEHKHQFEYFLIDYCYAYEYMHNNKLKELIDSQPISNSNSFELQKILNKPFDECLWNKLQEDTYFFKMSYKGNFKTKENNKETFYSYLIKRYAK